MISQPKTIDKPSVKPSILLPYNPRKVAVGEVDIMDAIPDDFLKTVVFLCVENEEGNREPKATGFLVKVPVEDSNSIRVDYVVTAGHCIEEARQYGKIYIRANLKRDVRQGTLEEFIEFPTKIDDWYLHDNADVAAIPSHSESLPRGVQYTDMDLMGYQVNEFVGGGPDYRFIGDTKFGSQNIQPRVGHQVYFIGLFTETYGNERNLPIARFGHISRMPSHLEMKLNNTICSRIAYLVEFHSIGGHSGSPVFFLYPTMLKKQLPLRFNNGIINNIEYADNLGWTSGFLGLVSGHYDIKELAKTSGDICGQVQTNLNSGIAFVTPAEAVTQLLMREDMKEHRKSIKERIELNKPTPTLDMGALTKEDFHDISS